MKGPVSSYRAGAAVISATLLATYLPLVQAAGITVTVGSASMTAGDTELAGDPFEIFMDEWDVYGEDVFSSMTAGQGSWMNGYADLGGFELPLKRDPADSSITSLDQELSINRLYESLGPTGGDSIVGEMSLPGGSLISTYTLADLGSGVSTITESFIFDITATADTYLSFFVWANADLGANEDNDTGGFNAGRDEYTQTDGDAGGREYLMTSSVASGGVAGIGTKTAVANHRDILDSLADDSITDLGTLDASGGGTGTVTGDATVAFQYNLFWAAGTSDTVIIDIFKKTSVPTSSLPVPAPEPASLALLAAGGILLLGVSRRRRS